MALPQLRLRILPKFPARVLGVDGIAIDRSGGTYTIRQDWSGIAPAVLPADIAQMQLLVRDTALDEFVTIDGDDFLAPVIPAFIADQPTAEAGISNTTLMSPLRTKQQIDARVGTGAGDLAAGDDARLSDERVPLDSSVTNAKVATPATAADAVSAAKLAFRQLGTDAVDRLVQDELRDTVKPEQYWLAVDADWSNALVRANTYLAANGGGTIKLGRRVYTVTPGTVTLSALVGIKGSSQVATVIRATTATGDVLTLNGAYCNVSMIRMDSAVARTAGRYIAMTTNCSTIDLSHISMVGPFVGLNIPGIALVALRHVDINGTVATTGRSIDITGGFAVLFDGITCRNDPGARPFAHVNVEHVEDLTINNSQLISAITNLNVAPGTGQAVGLIRTTNTQYDDASGSSIRIAPSTGGVVNEVVIESQWVKGVGADILITNAAGGTVNSVQVNNTLLTGSDVGIDAVGVGNIMVDNLVCGAHSTGVAFDGVSGGHIKGGCIGPHGLYGGNTTGVVLTGTTDNVFVGAGVKLTGNTTPLTYSASGSNNKIEGAIGYPATGAIAITVGASPFTYTAGPTPEAIYVNAGTVSLIAVNGVGMLQSSGHAVPLAPNHSMTVTYSSAPTMVKVLG